LKCKPILQTQGTGQKTAAKDPPKRNKRKKESDAVTFLSALGGKELTLKESLS